MNRRKFIKHGALWVPTLLLSRKSVGQFGLQSPGFVGQLSKKTDSTFTYYSTYFDGTNDYLLRGAALTGCSDGKVGTVSCWMKMDPSSSDTTEYIVLANLVTARFKFSRLTTGRVAVVANDSGGSSAISLASTAGIVDNAGGWCHVLATWDAASAVSVIYINGANETVTSTEVDLTIQYNRSDWAIGATTAGGTKFYGYLSELWFNTEYLDITVLANREKFRTSGGKPADLGADGSTPTGNQPLIYMHNPYDSFGTNSGSGGNFSVTGSLGDGGSDKP